MSSFRRKRGTYKIQDDNERQGSSRTSKKKMMTCFVDLLDENTMNIEIERNAKGQALLDETFKRLDLVEKDYFGLMYSDSETGLMYWLETHKKIKKQNRGEHILKFKLCVKFYVSEPGKLSEEYTRYLFYLQCKQDLQSGKLVCTDITSTQLAAYVVQAELGDYDPVEHSAGYVSELRLLPHQTHDLEEEIAQLHVSYKGLKCDDAEYKFLEIAKRLPMYGIDFHPAKDHEKIDLMLGVMASGIVVYLKDNKINSFSWANIMKISFKKKRFYIQVRANNDDKYQSKIIGFIIVPYRACKNVWKRCVEYHSFFRLNSPRDMPASGMLRLGSKYHYTGRTQKEAISDYNNYIRTNSSFERTPSKRLSRRKGNSPNKNSFINNNSLSRNNNANHVLDNSFNTPTKNHNNNHVRSTPFTSPDPTTPHTHASTPSDTSRDPTSPNRNARFDYDPKTGEVEINSTLNTSTPSVEYREQEEGIIQMTIMPDSAGKFGFNVRGGYDQKIPVIVSKVARGSPAAAALPCLEEGDQVISINQTSVDTLSHSEIVSMIQLSSAKHGQLVLVVRKNDSSGSTKEDLETPLLDNNDSHFELPDLPKFNAETANLLDRSITILQKSLHDGSLSNKFNNLYRQTPGLTMVSAKMDENHSKNRFRDTVPYDTTRVKLMEGNDYINASYIDLQIGADNLSYIASQGPMSSTVGDHWQMIWEQEVELVVMVVECIEKNSVKCSQYWPEPTQTATYNNLQVYCASQDDMEECIERVFEVKQDGIERTVRHLQYTAWPHHGAPEQPGHFVSFIRLISERRSDVETPVLVHCSTGIGRTGVVLLLEAALNLIQTKQGMYPLDMVTVLRDQRPKLIQSYSLFKFACECILYLYGEAVAKQAEEKTPTSEEVKDPTDLQISDPNLAAS